MILAHARTITLHEGGGAATGKLIVDVACKYIRTLETRKMEYKLLPICLCLTILAATTSVQSLRDIHYALFTSGPDGGFGSSGAIPAMELAEGEILKDPSVLEGFRFTHVPVEDTLVSLIILNFWT